MFPDKKIWAGGIGGALATVLIAALNYYWFDGGISGEIAAAITAIVVFITGYMVPSSPTDSSRL